MKVGFCAASIVVGDFNGDGKLDLLVGSGARNSVSLLLGKGDGTFQPPLNYDTGSTGFNSSRVGAGDFNDDGRLDIAVANSTGSTISVLLQPSLTPGPRALLWPTSLTFANQAVGTTSAPQTVTLTNYGLSSLHISSKAGSNNFSETDDCGPNLASGASCTFSLTFSPTPQGNATGTLSVTDDAPGSPQIVNLDAESTTVQLVPSSMRFICDIHRPYPCLTTQIATLTNTGSHTLVISSISIGVLNNPLTETNNCPRSLDPGKSCTITVKYHGGIGTGYLGVADNATGSPQTISLSAYEF